MYLTSVYKHLRFYVPLFLISSCTSASVPILSLFLHKELQTSEFQVGLVYVVSTIVGTFLLPIIGKRSDSNGTYKTVVITSLIWLALGALVTSFITSYYLYLLIALLFNSFLLVPSSQYFAFIGQKIQCNTHVPEEMVGRARIGYIIGWLFGPSISAILFFIGLGYRHVFFTQGVLLLVTAGIIACMFRDSHITKGKISQKTKIKITLSHIPLGVKVVFISLAFVLSGDTVRVALLPIIAAHTYGANTAQISLLTILIPIAEIPLVLLASYLLKRISTFFLLFVTSLSGLSYFILVPMFDNIMLLYAIQLLYAVIPAFALTVAIPYCQKSMPDELGLASSLVSLGQNIAILISTAIITIGLSFMNTVKTFLLPIIFMISTITIILFTTLVTLKRRR